MQKRVRDPRAGYFQSLDVLRAAKACGVYTKSSIMLGLGETDDEIIDTMYDLKDAVRLGISPMTVCAGQECSVWENIAATASHNLQSSREQSC